MSDQYLYRCKNCGFRVSTDDAGCECTMSGIAYLYKCENCKKLFQLWQSVDLLFKAKFNEVEIPKFWYGDGCDVEVKNDCPICKATGSLKKWKPADGCPECGEDILLDLSFGVIHTD